MNLNHLNVFLAVAEEGSIRKGAARLNICPPAVSVQMTEFERALGTPLFDRLHRGTQLTETGLVLHGYARRLFAIEAEAEEALRELRGMQGGRLCIGASSSIGTYLLPRTFAAFRRAYPGVALQLEIGNPLALEAGLEEGTLDLAFTEGILPSENLESFAFRQDAIVAITAPDYAPLLSESEPLYLQRFCQEPFLLDDSGSGMKESIERELRAHGIKLRPAMTLRDTEAVKRFVAAGVGVAIVSRLTMDAELSAGLLAIVPLTDLTLNRPLRFWRRRGKRESGAARAFLHLVGGADK